MASPGSVSHWIGLLKTDDDAATQRPGDRNFARLVGHVRLRELPRGRGDEEDVALRTFNHFYLAARRGQFPRLEKQNGSDARENGLDVLDSHEPTPEFAALLTEECRDLLRCLHEGLRAVAVAKMEGYPNEAALGCSVRTIWERRARDDRGSSPD
jgi:hypothetical protein